MVEDLKNHESGQADESPMATLADEKSFEEHMVDVNKELATENDNQNEKKPLSISEIVNLLDQEEEYNKRVEEYGSAEDDAFEFINGTPFDEEELREISRKIDPIRYTPEYYEAKEIIEDTYEVRQAIDNTKTNLPSYFRNTCKQRLSDGAGSIFDSISSTRDMERALTKAHWKKAEHPDVMPGCQAYVTKDIKGGHLGLLKIADLPDDAVITASDPKNTGKVSMTVSGEKGPETEETWLIIGKEEGTDVVFTFHPGEPVRPSVVEVKDCPDGTKLTKDQAIALGFDLAKIV